MKTIEGDLNGKGLKIALVVSRFNDFISTRLEEGAISRLRMLSVSENDIEVVRVTGSYEMPGVADMLAKAGRFNALICLGAVIRGDTPHFEYVAAEAAKGIAAVSMANRVPVVFGVITADSVDQAIERAGTKAGNKGADAASSAVEMANLYKKL